jgi:hypothetical protein
VSEKDKKDLKAKPGVQPIDSPEGLDLHPAPPLIGRISKRVGVAIGCVIIGLLVGFAYGGCRRTQQDQAALRQAGLPKTVTPATQAGTEFTSLIPPGNLPLARQNPGAVTGELQAPGSPCGVDPRTGQAYRYNPQTGQSCDGNSRERIVVRQAFPAKPQPTQSTQVQASLEPTPEERRLAKAYQREQEAMIAPTSIAGAPGGASSTDGMPRSDNANLPGVADLT